MLRILSADPDPAVYLFADPAPDPGYAVTLIEEILHFFFFQITSFFNKDKFNLLVHLVLVAISVGSVFPMPIRIRI
jgi:hypothetical protein